MNQRAHPTVRPYALALGVMPSRGVKDQLSFMGPAAAQDLATALLLDTLGALSTFPVRHRVVFTDGEDAVTREAKLPATWRELAQRGPSGAERVLSAFEDLLGLGAEAILLVTADGPMMPLGPLFDGIMWLLPKKRLIVGGSEQGGLYALGCAEPIPFLRQLGGGLGLGSPASEAGAPNIENAISDMGKAQGLDVTLLPKSYRVGESAGLERLKKEVAGGMFAPHCRKLFERP
ncbi:MAG: DUF2064 domain-containing protein [Polyangiaceae bacterium]